MKTNNAADLTINSEYNARAVEFLRAAGVRFSARLADQKPAPWHDEEKNYLTRNRFRVTFSRAAVPVGCSPRISFDFWASHNDWKNGVQTLPAYDVLACISSDAFCPDNFADFCAEFGYDQDSRRAEKIFRRCSKFARKLQGFFTGAELEKLAEIQ